MLDLPRQGNSNQYPESVLSSIKEQIVFPL